MIIQIRTYKDRCVPIQVILTVGSSCFFNIPVPITLSFFLVPTKIKED
jgi:hypothetical protein